MTTNELSLSSGILDNRGRPIPRALVVEWGSWSVRVVCPYCGRCHHHGPGRLPLTGQIRVAHCGRSPVSYQLFYPFESPAQYSYIVDKEKELFVTVGVELPSDDENDENDESETGEDRNEVWEEDDEVDEAEAPGESGGGSRSPEAGTDDNNHNHLRDLENQVERLAMGEETSEALSFDKSWDELMEDASHRQKLFRSHCISNDLPGVAALLQTYEDDPFVSYKDADGDNCIALAATEGHDEMIQFLQSKGGDLNNVNSRGRTPLMMAALWGRLKVVDYLLDHGADPYAKDRNGQSAYFYSRPSRRMRRLRDKFGHYHESNGASSNRKFITVMLQAYEPATAANGAVISGSSNEVKVSRFINNTTDLGIQIGFYEQLVAYDVPDKSKTVARLDRGPLFSVVSAASGWRTDFAIEHVLDNLLWRDRVLELCQLIGYALPEHDLDQRGWPGSYFASHAEKKLVAFYISQHVILPSALLEAVAISQRSEWMQRDITLQHLEFLGPETPTVPAKIQVSRPVCPDCKLFISHVKEVLGASFEVEHC